MLLIQLAMAIDLKIKSWNYKLRMLNRMELLRRTHQLVSTALSCFYFLAKS